MADGHQDGSSLDASYGGVNLSVKGSMVVLAMLVLSEVGVTLWALNAMMRRLEVQDEAMQKHMATTAEYRVQFTEQHNLQIREIEYNRMVAREVEKVCVLTPEQRVKLQQTLSPAMLDLLMDQPRYLEREKRR